MLPLSLLPSFVETNIHSTNPPWGQDVLQARDSVTTRKLCPRSLRRAHGHVEIQLMLHCILVTHTEQAPDEKLIHFTDGGGGSSGGNARTRHRRLCRSCPEGKGGRALLRILLRGNCGVNHERGRGQTLTGRKGGPCFCVTHSTHVPVVQGHRVCQSPRHARSLVLSSRRGVRTGLN